MGRIFFTCQFHIILFVKLGLKQEREWKKP
jgi:hypothetical protein